MRTSLAVLMLAAAVIGLTPAVARADGADPCAGPPGGVQIVGPLDRFAAQIDRGGPVDIVAVGSSSTSGIGATGPDFAYPSRLEADLRRAFPTIEINVVNRGKGGEDAPEELARLSRDVIALRPELAIWQVGTNAVLRRDDLGADGEWMREGVALMRRAGIDVVLMDLQYAPRVLERSAYPAMEQLVADTADNAHAGLFRRFALMRYWQRSHSENAPAMVGPDGLHMTDAGYDCLAQNLAGALVASWRAETKLMHRLHEPSNALAGLPRAAPVSASQGP